MALLFPAFTPLMAPFDLLDVVMTPTLKSPTVSETPAGWTISHNLPGVAAKVRGSRFSFFVVCYLSCIIYFSIVRVQDVTVDVHTNPTGHSTLRLAVEPSIRHTLRLPLAADLASIRASVVHGLLRVTLPRKAPQTYALKVAAAIEAAAAPDSPSGTTTTPHAREQQPEMASVSLPVPGLSNDEARRTGVCSQ